jgi:hypothetical protein
MNGHRQDQVVFSGLIVIACLAVGQIVFCAMMLWTVLHPLP